ncbi:MAG TPA: S53 family peptidase [Streptosporangiaceae bacterium]
MAATAGVASASASPATHGVSPLAARVAALEYSHPAGKVAGNAQIGFDMVLSLRHAAAAEALVRSVSAPGSAQFHKYLTTAAWEARFGPTQAQITKAESWLRHNGFSVVSVPKTRLYVSAQGSAHAIEHAFGVQLGYYKVNGKTVRLAKGTVSIPSGMMGTVSGVSGLSQYLATTDLTQNEHASSTASVKPNQEPAPPAGFRNPQPCSASWGQKADTKDSPKLYKPYTNNSYDICGYVPSQMRDGYGLNKAVSSGAGKGVTVAIVDAYDSPTLQADAAHYFALNDSSNPLSSAQFDNVEPSKIDDQAECGASGWFPEQALDVESVHSMAPAANIMFVGGKDCTDNGLLDAVNTAISNGANVISDSWGNNVGDLLTDQATKNVYDNTFMLADATGVSVLFSSGDDGDNFADFGITSANYPPSSPFVTAVGGTTLEVNASNQRAAELGWSTARSVMCQATAKNCGSSTTPLSPLAFQGGGGGGTSYVYSEPFYQTPVVPSALALRNQAITGVPTRVVPDISMDADAQSGLLIGLTQTYPHGTHYGQFKEGGTSLASPLLAGVIADTDGAAGAPLGFLNPVLYKAWAQSPSAFNDIMPPANPNKADVIRVDYANTVNPSAGFLVSVRAINYAGPETFCDATGNCATRNVTLTTGKGYDSLTGLGSASAKFISILSKF